MIQGYECTEASLAMRPGRINLRVRMELRFRDLVITELWDTQANACRKLKFHGF